MMQSMIYEAQKIIEQRKARKRRAKMRITGANTDRPGIASGAGAVTYHSLPWKQRAAVNDYLDELRQQSKWDAEKCANQQ